MTAQAGRAVLLKVDSTGSGVFQTVAGLRAKSLSINAETIDITNQDSPSAWRELLAAGTRSARIQGSGVFTDAASDLTIRSYLFAATIRDWQVIIPNFGTIAGPFQVVQLEYAGDHNGEATFSLALESAGVLSFTAAP